MNERNKRILFGMLTIAIILGTIPICASQSTSETEPSSTAHRNVPINVKIVFIGIDQNLIDKEYMTWNNPHYRYQSYLIPGINTNVIFNLNYDYVFATPQFENEFTMYLSSIARVEKRSNVMWNLTYFGIDETESLNYTNFRTTTLNTFYSADDVESWLINHANEYGGSPSDGYTLIISDLSSKVPSMTPDQYQTLMKKGTADATPHYYNKTFTDSDLGIVRNRRWMTSWGGRTRLYYIDLSAGPSIVTTELPIQLSASKHSINYQNAYGKNWLNQYIASYISGVVYNLFTPDFVYPINYAKDYRIKIAAIDNRTEQNNPPLEQTVNTDIIKNELQRLLSFSKVDVEVKYSKITDHPDLLNVIVNSTIPSTQIPSIEPVKAVDAAAVYNWLNEEGKGHIKDFFNITRDMNEYDIPVFVFAFDKNYEFAFAFKDQIAYRGEADRTIWGVSLYDMVLIGHSTRDFQRGDLTVNEPKQPGKGYGFSNTIIHEVGHMIGLNHPFIYDETEDFVASVMAYYPYENQFSQFDIDVIQRGLADQLMIYTSSTLSETPSVIVNFPGINSANNDLKNAEDKYSKMDYQGSINDAYDSATQAAQAKMLAPNFFATSGLIVGLAIGAILGLTIGYYAWKRKPSIPTSTPKWTQPQTTPQYPCPSCNQPLTWVQEYQRWYCQNCKRYV